MADVAIRPRHEELLAAAVRLFRERGYHATSMQDLAASLRVQRGSLYHYIEAKEDLLWEIMERALGRLFAAVEPVALSQRPPTERLRAAIAAHLAVAAELRDELTILHVELKSLSADRRRRMADRRDRYEALFRDLIGDGVRSGAFRPVDPKTATFAILGACNWFTQWFRPDGALPHTAFAAAFADLFVLGLRAGA
ncbi:MAG: TetR/AcrR family transcriptional regulator [Armatimonadota bacterium]|nr:TetR/AcrR family transcriptional regulator [Armatimonadota bacterium]MDR5696346.1 TetR/AcrR family transcriptional regulator [Armatimonadota bacterium]